MKTTKTTFYYSPKRDLIGLGISSIIIILGFFPLKALLTYDFSEIIADTMVNCLLWLYVLICTICIVSFIPDIYIKTYYYSLVISENDITYHTGWITQKSTVIPAKKIRSCTKKSGWLQRLCKTMDISITTAGDDHEILFTNIANGNKAYRLICNLIQGNEEDIS